MMLQREYEYRDENLLCFPIKDRSIKMVKFIGRKHHYSSEKRHMVIYCNKRCSHRDVDTKMWANFPIPLKN